MTVGHKHAVKRFRIVSIAAAGALVLGTSAHASERNVTRAGVEFSPPQYERLADVAKSVFGSDAQGLQKPAVSRAGQEYAPPKAGLTAAAGNGITPRGLPWTRISRAGLEYVPPGVDVVTGTSGVRVATTFTAAGTVDGIPHANRAGVVKHHPKYRDLAEFRDAWSPIAN